MIPKSHLDFVPTIELHPEIVAPDGICHTHANAHAHAHAHPHAHPLTRAHSHKRTYTHVNTNNIYKKAHKHTPHNITHVVMRTQCLMF